MIKVWDYFMRRKGILLLILAVFLASSILSYNVFRSQATDRPLEYISIHSWGSENIEIPRTGGETPIVLAILQPREVTDLDQRPHEIMDPNPDVDINLDLSQDSDENPDQIDEATPDETGEISSGEIISDEIADNDYIEVRDPLEQTLDSEESQQQEQEADPSGTRPMDTQPATPDSDSPEVSSGEDAASEQDLGYIVFLVIIGLIVAGFGTYFLEQHFWR